jgi:hypothetical protein
MNKKRINFNNVTFQYKILKYLKLIKKEKYWKNHYNNSKIRYLIRCCNRCKLKKIPFSIIVYRYSNGRQTTYYWALPFYSVFSFSEKLRSFDHMTAIYIIYINLYQCVDRTIYIDIETVMVFWIDNWDW